MVDQDILFFPDGALSLNSGGLWEVFLPWAIGPCRCPHITRVTPLQNVTPVLEPSGQVTDPYELCEQTPCSSAMESGGSFHGEYHQIDVPLPNAPPPYHASMGRATAPLGSTAFTYDTPSWFLTASEPANYNPNKMAYGAGGGSIFQYGEFYYLYYYDWDGDQGVHVARACAKTCGENSTWRKWTGSGFESEAFASDFLSPSGASSVIVPATPTGFDAFNVVSYNTYLDSYLMVSATEQGIGLRSSANGIDWSERVSLL